MARLYFQKSNRNCARQIALCCFVGMMCFTSSSYADSVQLDFEGLTTSASGGISTGDVVIEDGFRLDKILGHNPGFAAWQDGWQDGRGSSNGTTTLGLLTNNAPTNVWSLSSNDGGIFALLSIDLGETFQMSESAFDFNARTVTFVGSLAQGGTVSQTHTLDLLNDGLNGIADFETVVFSSAFTNLVSVEVTAESGHPTNTYYNFDNIVVEAQSIPEPISGTILIGFGLVAMAQRRRR